MQISELLSAANSIEENVSEKEVVEFYKRNNFGYWPSELSKATLRTETGNVVLSAQQGMIEANHDITPAGKKWLLNHFFTQSKAQTITDMKNLKKGDDKPTSEEFHDRIVVRMSGISKFIRTGQTVLAFSERKRTNLDGSKLYSYDIVNMDENSLSKHAIMVPSSKTVIYVFEQYKNEIVKSDLVVNGRFFEGLEPWERAEYIAMTPVDIFTVEPVSRVFLKDVFSLTEIADEITEDKLSADMRSLFENS